MHRGSIVALALMLPVGYAAATNEYSETCTPVVPGLPEETLGYCEYSGSYDRRPRACGDERHGEYEGFYVYHVDEVTGGAAVDVGTADESSGVSPYTAHSTKVGVYLIAIDDGVFLEVSQFEDHCELGSGAAVGVLALGTFHTAGYGDDVGPVVYSDLMYFLP